MLWVFIAYVLFSILWGFLLKCILRLRTQSYFENYLIGYIFIYVVQGIAYYYACIKNIAFDNISNILNVILVIGGLLGVICVVVERFMVRSQPAESSKEQRGSLKSLFTRGPGLFENRRVFLILVLLMVAFVGLVMVLVFDRGIDRSGIVEIAQTTIQTNSIYQYNPMTGGALYLGIEASKKWICLPIWYANLTRLACNRVTDVIYIGVAIMNISTIIIAYTQLFMSVFGLRKKTRILASLLILLLLILSGDYSHYTWGYMVLNTIHSGETIVIFIIIPYIISILYSSYSDYIIKRLSSISPVDGYHSIVVKLIIAIFASIFLTEIYNGLLWIIVAIVVFFIVLGVKVLARRRA